MEKDANSKANSSAVKAKLKVEKLKRKLEKEERRVAKAEAKMVKLKAGIGGDGGAQDDVKKRKRSESPGNQNNSILYSSEQVKDETVTSSLNIGNASLKELEADLVQSEGKNNVGEDLKQDDPDSGSLEASSKMLDPLTPTSQPSLLEPPDLSSERDQSPHAIENVNPADEIATIHQHAALGSMDSPKRENDNSPQSPHDSTSSSTLSSSSMLTDSDDETSSDDSSSGASSSSVPECRPSTRTQPDKVAPPKRAQSRTICRNFLQHGRCYKGRGCRFRHELPERGNLAMMQRRQQKHARRDRKAQRVSLHQRVSAPHPPSGLT